MPRRYEAEDQGGRQREPGREENHPEAQSHVIAIRHRQGSENHERANAPGRDQNPKGAAKDRQEEAFGRKLANELRARRADSRPDGELPGSRAGACQQQIRQIRTRDEEDERDGSGQGEQGGLHVANRIVRQTSDRHPHCASAVITRMGRDEFARELVHRALGLCNRDTVTQTPNRRHDGDRRHVGCDLVREPQIHVALNVRAGSELQ